jgi:Flp pilus assembly protein TadD
MRLIFRLIFISGFILALSGCGDPLSVEKSAKNASLTGRQEVKLRLAHATEESGDYAQAQKLFQQVVDQAPEIVGPHLELADFYRRHHEDAKAIESMNAALKLEPENTQIDRSLANIYIGMNEPEKAITKLDDALAINARDPLLYNSKGVALDQMGDYAQAQQCYKTAYSLDASGGATYKINISMSYILSGRYDKAIALLRPMLDAPDAPPIVRQNLALAYGLKGESETALQLGLQDLSDSEAQENLRFYRMLAQRHHAHSDKQIGSAPSVVPSSVVKDLFPETDPSDLSAAPMEVMPPHSEDTGKETYNTTKATSRDSKSLRAMIPSSDANDEDDNSVNDAPAFNTNEISLPLPVLKPDRY